MFIYLLKIIKMKSFLKALGPGILFASTAIGVSHLVQSTRAGADFGFDLLWLVILTNLLKYPFFEYGSRYANATGTSLIDGYRRIGKWVLWTYIAITLLSMFFVCAAVGFVTAGFMDNLFGLNENFGISIQTTAIVLFILCTSLLLIGKYAVLDKLIKVVGTVLLLSTLMAFIITLFNGPAEKSADFIFKNVWSKENIPFIVALMGWMPTAVDLSTWNSLWTVERIKETNYKPSLRETLMDFNFGYIVSAILAVCFITLGAYLMYPLGKVFSNKSHEFAGEVVRMYTTSIGDWSYILIAASSFSIMFGTAIAVFDGYARAMSRSVEIIRGVKDLHRSKSYNMTLIILILGSYFIIWQFLGNLKSLVDLAMIISFLIAPFIAVVNFRLVSSTKYVESEYIPPTWLKIISYAGIAFLIFFALFYLFI